MQGCSGCGCFLLIVFLMIILIPLLGDGAFIVISLLFLGAFFVIGLIRDMFE